MSFRRDTADLLLIIDDVGLANMDQTVRVVSVMRRAVQTHLGALQQTRYGRVSASSALSAASAPI